jgi:hypothetical protein
MERVHLALVMPQLCHQNLYLSSITFLVLSIIVIFCLILSFNSSVAEAQTEKKKHN